MLLWIDSCGPTVSNLAAWQKIAQSFAMLQGLTRLPLTSDDIVSLVSFQVTETGSFGFDATVGSRCSDAQAVCFEVRVGDRKV